MEDDLQANMRLFEELCHQAVQRHGADMREIERDVAEAIERLPPARRQALRETLNRYLDGQAKANADGFSRSH
ncbi:hypothetical protein [Consotaella aegiceratis]|uniref:hypothetical protein n=1 Tax=Consotaella aegiceratis TaxID=3097961 RepID=UPI002F405C79